MACPMESNIERKIVEKLTKYRQLAYEIRERRKEYLVEIVPLVIGCCGGGFGKVVNGMNKTIEEENISIRTAREMQKTVVMESETIIRKVLSGLIQT